MSAVYDDVAVVLTLVFDEAVDITNLTGADIFVDDPVSGNLFDGSGGVNQPTATTLEVILVPVGTPVGSVVTMTALSSNGLVAVSDGEPWAGVTDLELPFP